MQPKLLENHKWFSLQVYLLILALTFLSGLEPALHNHDLDETHKDCASCTWAHSNVSEPASSLEKDPSLDYQSNLEAQTLGIFKHFSFSNSSRAPPSLRSQTQK